MYTLATLSDSRLPSLGALLVKALLVPKPGMDDDAPLPRIERTVTGISVCGAALESFNAMCGFTRSEQIPLPYYYVLAQRVQLSVLTDRVFPLGIAGLVQTDAAFRRYARADTGAAFDLRCSVGSDACTDSGRVVEIATDFYDNGTRILECRSHYIHTTRARSSGKKPKPAAPPLEGAVKPLALAANAGRRYARVSGDYNPIHLHALTARPFGFRKPIAHGIYLVARVNAALEDAISFPVKEAHVEFKRPVYLPSTVDLAYAFNGEGSECRFEVQSGAERKPHMKGFFSSVIRESQ